MTGPRKSDMAAIVNRIERQLLPRSSEQEVGAIIERLVQRYGGCFRFVNGAYHLRIAGISCSCTAGRYPLLRRWLRKAQDRLSEARAFARDGRNSS